MGAACVTTVPKDHGETKSNMETPGKSKKDDLLPTSPIVLLFDVMSEEIGYESSALQSYCDKLQSLWIYRVIDLLNIDDTTWNQLEIPSVLEHVIRDYLNELKNTQPFINYSQQSHTDIYVTFINKDMRTLFKQLLESVNDLGSAAKDIETLENILSERYLLNTDKLKKYITKQEWDEIDIPINLKTIICLKINLNIDDEKYTDDEKYIDNNTNEDEKSYGNEEGEFESDASTISNLMHTPNDTPTQAIQVVDDDSDSDDSDSDEKNEQMVNNKMNEFNEMINKNIKVTLNMMDVAKYYSKELLVNIDKIYNHLKYFVVYGYNTLYHLSFIADEMYDKLLLVTSTPNTLKLELFELLQEIRNKYKYSSHNISEILPFSSNLYWETGTADAFEMLSKDINLNLEKECNILMSNFYSNIWDWQFIDNNMLLNELNGYRKYEIVRIRMQHMMKLCQYQYATQNIPKLPPIWNSQLNENLTIHKILKLLDERKEGSNNNSDERKEVMKGKKDVYSFHFDGLEYNEYTHEKIKILLEYLDNNFVRKLQFLPIQHRKNNKSWNILIQNNNISKHLRFKINFYALKGLPSPDDLWLNNYIHRHYKQILPQFNQSMDINIITGKHKKLYNDIQNKVICIENMLYSVNIYNKIQTDINNYYKDNAKIIEMSEMIKSTIQELDEMGLNEQFYEIIQFCGTSKLNKLKKNKFKLLMNNNNINISQFNQEKCNELLEIYNILTEMRDKIYSIPIDDILNLAQTLCGSVRWLKRELNNGTLQ